VFRRDLNPEWELMDPLPVSPVDYLYELIAAAAA